jgi:hypothetical protein
MSKVLKFICRDCIYKHKIRHPEHTWPPKEFPYDYVWIDGEKYLLVEKDYEVKCSECGKRNKKVYQLLSTIKW